MMSELLGDWNMALPSEVNMSMGTMAVIGVSSARHDSPNRPAEKTAWPAIVGLMQPILSDSAPDSVPIVAFTSG